MGRHRSFSQNGSSPVDSFAALQIKYVPSWRFSVYLLEIAQLGNICSFTVFVIERFTFYLYKKKLAKVLQSTKTPITIINTISQ